MEGGREVERFATGGTLGFRTTLEKRFGIVLVATPTPSRRVEEVAAYKAAK